MGAMFLAATFVAVRSAVKNAGSYAMQGAFRWLNNNIAHELLPSQTWRDALTTSAGDRLDLTPISWTPQVPNSQIRPHRTEN